MANCLVCSAAIEEFLDLGRMPLANGFLTEDQFQNEFFYNLRVAFCPECQMVQLMEPVRPDRLFHDHYPFYSSTSEHMREHFKRLATEIKRKYMPGDDRHFFVEIGCNDGILLQYFKDRQHLGIEPSENVAQAARDKGLNVQTAFFDTALAQAIADTSGRADVIVAANTFCHIPNMFDLLRAVNILLKPEGVLIFEDPYLGAIVRQVAFDQFYDEHVYYFSVSSVMNMLAEFDFTLMDVQYVPTHGGSMRYYAGVEPASRSVSAWLDSEEKLNRRSALTEFASRVGYNCQALTAFLSLIKNGGGPIVGYGATSKSTIALNFCDIGPETIEYICDTTPAKIGKFSPGMHIPIKSYQQFLDDMPPNVLLLAWNHKLEIMAKEQEFKRREGRFICYVPKVEMI